MTTQCNNCKKESDKVYDLGKFGWWCEDCAKAIVYDIDPDDPSFMDGFTDAMNDTSWLKQMDDDARKSDHQ